MQSEYTGAQLKKKERHKTRKFSQDEPYDRASDEQLANSGLSGGKKLSLQPGSLIQGNADSLRQDVSPQNFTQQAPLTTVNTGLTTTTPNFTTATQNYTQPGFIANTGSNIPMNYGTQGVSQPNYTTSASTGGYTQPNYIANTGNNIPMNYGTQGFSQPNYTTNASTESYTQPNYTISTSNEGYTQPNYTTNTGNERVLQSGYIANSGNVGITQSNYTLPMNSSTQPQPNFDNNLGTNIQQDFSQQNFNQPGLTSNTGFTSNLGTSPNYINSTGTQNFAQPGLIGGAVLGTGLGIYGANALSQGYTQPGLTSGNLIPTQGLTQPGRSTGSVNNTMPLTTGTNVAPVPANTQNKSAANANGVFTFKPLEAKFPKDMDRIGKMDPYCKIKIGTHSGRTAIAKSEGVHPVWNDVITLEKKHNEQFAKIKIRDHDRLRFNEKIGQTKIPLGEIASKGKVNQWFPVYKKDQLSGEILMEISFQPKSTAI